MPIRLALLAALLASAVARADAPAVGPTEGTVVAIGGALRDDNDSVWSRLVELAGGLGAKWMVLPTASAAPDETGRAAAAALARRGAVAEVLPVSPRLASPRVEDAVRDPALAAKVRASRGVFFTGGEQGRIVDALLPGGEPTPLLEAIRDLQRAGGVVAGTSAGAAILGERMIRDIPDPVAALRGELREGIEIDRGLGFLGAGLLTDQHFLKRGRIGRLLPVMARTGSRVGVGVDEDTAAIFRGPSVEVMGASGVLVADLDGARAGFGEGGFRLADARLTYLESGDRYDLARREATPSPAKRAGRALDPRAPDFRPRLGAPAPSADILGDSVIAKSMFRLLDSPASEAFGRAGAAPGTAGEARDFAFRLRKGPATRGWSTGPGEGEAFTVIDVLIDISPPRRAQPAYAPSHQDPEGKERR